MDLAVSSFMLRRLVNTFSLYQSSTTHHFKYKKMPINIQYYLHTYSSILPRDCPVYLSPLTSCTHFLYIFDTYNFAVTHSNLTTQPNMSVLTQMIFNDDTKN